MNKSIFKSFLLLSICLITVMGSAVVANAEEIYNIGDVIDGSILQEGPTEESYYWNPFARAANGLNAYMFLDSYSKGALAYTANTGANTYCSIGVTAYIQKLSGNTWVSFKNFSDSKSSHYNAQVSGTTSATSGTWYRINSYHYAGSASKWLTSDGVQCK